MTKRHNRIKTHGHHRGDKPTSEYRAYTSAKQRCTNPNVADYSNYGGRGIQFRFKSFKQFIEHIGPKPSRNLTLDRIDNNGAYEPGNVQWATRSQQRKNQRALLAMETVSDILKLKELGFTHREIDRELNLTRNTTYRTLKRYGVIE